MSNEGPPINSEDSPPDIDEISGRQYPETPMPNNYKDDEEYDNNDYEEETQNANKLDLFENTLKVLFIAIAVAHLFTVWTLRADINIIMQYQNELAQQNKHITELLHNQHQVKWQIVPHP